MIVEAESKRPGPSTDLLEKIRVLRIERARVGAELSRLNERMKELNIQIGAYEDAATMVFGESQYSALMAAIEGNIQTRRAATGGLMALGKELLDGSKRKNLSGNWAKLLVSMSEHDSFGYDDLVAMSEIMDWGISKPTLRSQIKSYVDSDLVERIDNERGKFRVTPIGRTTAEAALHKAPARPALADALDEGVPLDLDDLLDDPASGSGGWKSILE
ncbi:MarR family transcriptional regulator [Rhizobium leguminosarum]|uniref:Uncharacterized protein n=2 Tax=Rhizobium leguminosarum TaxID=384 RepID=A0A154IE51_RHILE|nr:hypothetical protein [Rhizobium leguminosarum]KZA98860.1 hypothetical protein A4A59_25225 [Rhizobium leguminosarum]